MRVEVRNAQSSVAELEQAEQGSLNSLVAADGQEILLESLDDSLFKPNGQFASLSSGSSTHHARFEFNEAVRSRSSETCRSVDIRDLLQACQLGSQGGRGSDSLGCQ